MSSRSFFTLLTVLSLMLRMSVQQQSVGIPFTSPFGDYTVILPSTVAQCQPALIYYNISPTTIGGPLITMQSPDDLHIMELFTLPDSGSGYVQWLCNLPAGSVFQIGVDLNTAWYTVQSGSDSSCIGKGGFEVNPLDMSAFLATTYAAQVISANMQTERELSLLLTSTTAFPNAALATSTVAGSTVAGGTTGYGYSYSYPSYTYSTPALPSSDKSGGDSSASSHTPFTPSAGVIAGAVIGGVVFIAFIIALIIFFRHLYLASRRTNQQGMGYQGGYYPPNQGMGQMAPTMPATTASQFSYQNVHPSPNSNMTSPPFPAPMSFSSATPQNVIYNHPNTSSPYMSTQAQRSERDLSSLHGHINTNNNYLGAPPIASSSHPDVASSTPSSMYASSTTEKGRLVVLAPPPDDSAPPSLPSSAYLPVREKDDMDPTGLPPYQA